MVSVFQNDRLSFTLNVQSNVYYYQIKIFDPRNKDLNFSNDSRFLKNHPLHNSYCDLQ